MPSTRSAVTTAPCSPTVRPATAETRRSARWRSTSTSTRTPGTVRDRPRSQAACICATTWRPVSQFVIDKTDFQNGGADINLDGSLSSDPNGQVLSYQWYQGSSCSSPSVPLTGGTTQQFNAGDVTNGTYTYSLLVTNTGGLTNCSSQTVTVP